MGQQENTPSVVVMTAGGINPQVMINALARHWPDLQIIEEQPESKSTIIKRRARRLGWVHAYGQLATMMASRLTKNLAARRTQVILDSFGQSAAVDDGIPVHKVASLNDVQCHDLLASLNPQVVFTISCRLLSKATLAACPCPIVNFHAGINPAYRGQMGGYWSLVEGDSANFGATVHIVDAGTDTGGTLYEQRVQPASGDFIATYPLLLTAASTDIAVRAVQDAIEGNLRAYQPTGHSVLRFPPPLWTWVWNGVTKRIW